jgi:uncharacterized membrane protein
MGPALSRAFVAAPTMLLLDAAWLRMNQEMYNRMVIKVQSIHLRVRYLGAALSYASVFAGLMLIAMPNINSDYAYGQTGLPSELKTFLPPPLPPTALYSLPWLCLRHAGLLGWLMYGCFNATNYGIFNNYDWRTGLIDTAWGGAMMATTALIAKSLVP